jgi:outer membrane protein assembly factor BamD
MLISKNIIKPLVIVLLGVFVASCSKFNKILKSPDTEKKYEAAMKYYKKKDYFRAGQLFDDLLIQFRGTQKAEEIYYYYTYCKYYQYEIPTAAFHFKNFYESYPNSKYAEECFFMYAYCNYIEAYPYNLDPTYTHKAIDVFQLFVNVYPQSKYVKRCNTLIDECRARLQKKAYEAAKLYYKIEDFKAAYVSFKNLINDYPDLDEERKEESEYLIITSAYKYAEQSINKKKTERYLEAVKAYTTYVEDYPEGKYLEKALKIKEKAEKGAVKYQKAAKTANTN